MSSLNVTHQASDVVDHASALEAFTNAILQSVNSADTPSQSQDEQIKALEAVQDSFAIALSRIRSTLNPWRSRIYGLPEEILTTIFRHVIDLASTPSQDTTFRSLSAARDRCRGAGTSPAMSTVLALTQVCQHWRHILLEDPSFWTVVTNKNMKAADVFLQRSGAHLSLVVHINTTLPADQPLPPFLTEDGSIQPRLREIHWITQENTSRKAGYLLFPAPRLELLRLVYDAKDRDRDEESRNTPPILFAGHAPLLRIVFLEKIGWLPGNHFQSLSCLCLADIPLGFHEFIRLFSNCPVLEHLHLTAIRARAPPGRPPLPGLAIGPATLPRLRDFAFERMPTASTNDFLSYLARYQADITLRVTDILYGPAQPVVDINTLACEAVEGIRRLIAGCHFDNHHVSMAVYALGLGTRDVDIELRSGPSLVKLVHGVPSGSVTPFEWTLRQLDVFPLHRLHGFYLAGISGGLPHSTGTRSSARSLRSLIARMTGLRLLRCSTNNLPLFFLHLLSTSPDDALLPLRSEAPGWRVRVLHIQILDAGNVALLNAGQHLGFPDLSEIVQVVGVIHFTFRGYSDTPAYAVLVAALHALKERWPQRVSIADPCVS
ncbi:hypothetical protein FKP32DRAFT_575170 [Trametes sanguinea]|nr:hypothetical protein FKP32DRAFT_575170 [Trametes sanguinea]